MKYAKMLVGWQLENVEMLDEAYRARSVTERKAWWGAPEMTPTMPERGRGLREEQEGIRAKPI